MKKSNVAIGGLGTVVIDKNSTPSSTILHNETIFQLVFVTLSLAVLSNHPAAFRSEESASSAHLQDHENIFTVENRSLSVVDPEMQVSKPSHAQSASFEASPIFENILSNLHGMNLTDREESSAVGPTPVENEKDLRVYLMKILGLDPKLTVEMKVWDILIIAEL